MLIKEAIKELLQIISLSTQLVFSKKQIKITNKYSKHNYKSFIDVERMILSHHVPLGSRILDIGSGDGRVPLRLLVELKKVPSFIQFTNISNLHSRIVDKNISLLSEKSLFNSKCIDLRKSRIEDFDSLFDVVTAIGYLNVINREYFEKSLDLFGSLLREGGVLIFNLPTAGYIQKLQKENPPHTSHKSMSIHEIKFNNYWFKNNNNYLTSIGELDDISSIMKKKSFQHVTIHSYDFGAIKAGNFFVYEKVN